MASNEQRMTPLEIEDTNCKQRQEEIIDEQDPSNRPVQVKSPRRKVVIITAVIVVVVIVIVAAVLIGIFVSCNDKNSDNGKNKTENEGTGEETESIRTSTVEVTIVRSSPSLSHFSAEATIVKSSPSATKSFEVTSYILSHFHKTTAPNFTMTSTPLVSLSSFNVSSASTMHVSNGTTPAVSSNTTASTASSALSPFSFSSI